MTSELHGESLGRWARRCGITYRTFVLAPAAEVAPKMRHPVIGWPVERMLLHLQQASDSVALVSRRQIAGGRDCRADAHRNDSDPRRPNSKECGAR